MTVIARAFKSVPERSAVDTWDRIVDLIAPDQQSEARRELAAVAGVVCSCIADETLTADALVLHGVGPRLRIYALYGDDALMGEAANESALSWVPTDGEWFMSIPCQSDDLEWVQRSLAKVSNRVTARAVGTAVDGSDEAEERTKSGGGNTTPTLDLDAFFRR